MRPGCYEQSKKVFVVISIFRQLTVRTFCLFRFITPYLLCVFLRNSDFCYGKKIKSKSVKNLMKFP